MTLSRPRPVTPPYPENTVLVQGPTHPQKSVGGLQGAAPGVLKGLDGGVKAVVAELAC